MKFNLYSKSGIKEALSFGNKNITKSLGQNYLINKSAVEKIAKACHNNCEKYGTTRILEIGPGMGVLTAELLTLPVEMDAVEIEKYSYTILCENLHDEITKKKEKVRIINEDILTYFNQPSFLTVDNLALVGNLPYNITVNIILDSLEKKGSSIDFMLFMVQREVADRIISPPGSKVYGVISVFCQYFAKVSAILKLTPGSFHPAPNVDSTVLLFEVRKPPEKIIDYHNFKLIVKSAFNQRRKQMGGALRKSSLCDFDVDILKKVFEKYPTMPTRRAEDISPEEFVFLANCYSTLQNV